MENYYIVSADGKSWLYLGEGTIITSENHSLTNEVISFPLEDGSPLVDHVIVNADELEIALFASNASRQTGKDVFEALQRIRNSRALVSVYTYHTIYRGMVAKSVSISHAAPYTGAVNIIVSFQQVDFLNSQNLENPRSKFEEVDPEDYSYDPYMPPSQTELSAFDPAFQDGADMFKSQVDQIAENAKNGDFPAADSVVDSASDAMDLGDGELYEIGDEFDIDTLSTTSISADTISTAASSANASAVAAFENMAQKISNAYSTAGNLTQEISNKLRTVQSGISFISNLSVGAQRFARTIKGQVIGIFNYFDVLTGNWNFSLKDGQGADLIAGAAIVVGANALSGLNVKYPALQPDGTVHPEPLAIDTLYMSPPVTGKPLTTAKGMESTPAAFAQGSDGIAPCTIFFFTTAESSKAYNDLMLGLETRSPNVSISDMDYVIGA